MREKNIFLMGLGTGLVIVSIISLFLYNILKLDNNYTNNSINSTSTQTTIEATTQEVSSTEISIKDTEIDSTLQTTTKNLELLSKPNLEITTKQPLKIEN